MAETRKNNPDKWHLTPEGGYALNTPTDSGEKPSRKTLASTKISHEEAYEAIQRKGTQPKQLEEIYDAYADEDEQILFMIARHPNLSRTLRTNMIDDATRINDTELLNAINGNN